MLTAAILKKNAHLARRLFPVEPDPVSPDAHDIVEYVRKQKVEKVGEGPDDYVVTEIVVESSRCNRQAFIEQFRDDVGVLNILEKVRRSGDITLLNQTGASIPEGIQDYTDVPSSVGEALNAVKSGATSFEGLKAIFGDISFSDLAGLSEEQVKQYLDKYVAAHTPKAANTGGEK